MKMVELRRSGANGELRQRLGQGIDLRDARSAVLVFIEQIRVAKIDPEPVVESNSSGLE